MDPARLGIVEVFNRREAARVVARFRQPLQRRFDPSQGADELVLSLAVQAGHAEDFAPLQIEREPVSVCPQAQPTAAQDNLVAERLMRLLAVMRFGEIALAGHQLQQVFLGDLALLQHADVAAVAHDRRPVADADQLGNAVGHDDDRTSLVAQLAHFAEKAFGGIQIERGRRFVEDQDPGLGQQGAPDGNPLLDAERQTANQNVGIELDAGEFLHQGTGDFVFFARRARF